MSKYIFEVRRGDIIRYIVAEPLPVSSLFEKGRAKVRLDPKERNAFVVNTYKEAREFVDSFMKMSPGGVRRLLNVGLDYDEPVRIFIRRQDGNRGLIQTATTQRTYTFKEAA